MSNAARKLDLDAEVGIIDLWDEDVELLPEAEWPTRPTRPTRFDGDTEGYADEAFEGFVMLSQDPAPANPVAFVLDPLPLEEHRRGMQDEPKDHVQEAIMMRFPGREVAMAFDSAAAILKARHDLVAYDTLNEEPSREIVELLLANEPPATCAILHREWRQALALLPGGDVPPRRDGCSGPPGPGQLLGTSGALNTLGEDKE